MRRQSEMRRQSGVGRPLSFTLAALTLSELVRLDNYLAIRLWPAETLLHAAARLLLGATYFLVLSLILWALAWLFGSRGRFGQALKIVAVLAALVPCITLLANLDYLIEAAFVWRAAAFMAEKAVMALALAGGVLVFVRALRLHAGLGAPRLVPLLALFLPTAAILAGLFSLLGNGLYVIVRSLLLG